MNEQEKEINLKRLFYKALRSWRRAALAAAVGAVVVGGTKCTMELLKISDPEVVEARQIQYEGEQAKYQQEGEIILKEIDTLETTLTQQTDYNEHSVLMGIDPYNEWRGSVDFYVETDWQLMPELSYQNQNVANQIVRVYSTYISNGELYQYVLERMDSDLEIRYLREILSGTADAENYLLHFSVRGESEAFCKELLNYIEDGMRAKQTEIFESVGEYKLLTTNRATYSQINYALEQTQKDNLQIITDTGTALSAKQFELLEWKKDENKIELPVVGKGDAVKSGIKMAILTGLVVGAVFVLFYGVGYILSKLVQDRDEFDGWGVYVAELPRSYKKRAFSWLDRLFGQWFLGNVYAGEYEARLTASAKQIGEAAKLAFATEEPKLVLIGDVPQEELTVLAEAMQKTQKATGVHFVAAGNPCLSAESIDAVMTAEGVVLVAKQEYTKRETVYQIKAQLTELKKPLAAVVLTNADGIV